MGSTLTHGIYLPDEGERNCYNGLAANWSILDGAVGTIAEHTTALSGKAPLVHTHVKADITDFPAYGTTAGTICEGNDSRLSDARTPVAHTHGKADITNLFNSANEWSGNQTYSGVLSLSSSSDVAEQFKQKLPKDVSISNDAMARVNALVDSAGHYVVIETLGHWANYVAKNTTLKYKNDSTKRGAVELRLYSDGSGIFYPQLPFECDLGNSYNKWKTLNGVNPGALSLPDCQVTQSIDRTGWVYDGATYNTVLLATTDTNMTKNGWLYVRMTNTTSSDKLTIKYNSTADRYPTNTFGDAGGCIEAFVPVVADTNIYLLATKDLSFCKFYPCLGNVPSGV